MNNTEDVELRDIISDLCNEQADYPTDFAIRDIKKLIQQEANRQKLELLDELEVQSIYGHLAVPDCTHFIPLSAIQKERITNESLHKNL